jgi:hypothetical protein
MTVNEIICYRTSFNFLRIDKHPVSALQLAPKESRNIGTRQL